MLQQPPGSTPRPEPPKPFNWPNLVTHDTVPFTPSQRKDADANRNARGPRGQEGIPIKIPALGHRLRAQAVVVSSLPGALLRQTAGPCTSWDTRTRSACRGALTAATGGTRPRDAAEFKEVGA